MSKCGVNSLARLEGFKGFDYGIAYDVVYVFIAYPGIIIRIVIFKCIRYSEDG